MMKLDLFLTKHMYGDNNNNQFFMNKHENKYIKHVFDFRITKHININHDNFLNLDFFFNLTALESYLSSNSFL